jgi:phosphoglycolate phosphatase-like HAD superfamily hydrolase
MSRIRAAVFDFDGTISTLRYGWEEVMRPMMVEMIVGSADIDLGILKKISEEVEIYINESTGIQTIYQMEWLSKAVEKYGYASEVLDGWGYKALYNERLLTHVQNRIKQIKDGTADPENYRIKGSVCFLKELQKLGVEIYLASGTDHPDVVNEANLLQISPYVKDIAGAPEGRADCSKEKVIRDLIHEKGFDGQSLLVVGDGKVEISLGKEYGAFSLGIASDEAKREGINEIKRRRLEKSGADIIVGDFLQKEDLLNRIGL